MIERINHQLISDKLNQGKEMPLLPGLAPLNCGLTKGHCGKII